ncbi:hypothetical protein LTR95_017793 [Oleoguttula sp. CCFEE 5521]
MADGETRAGDAMPAAEPMQLVFRDSNNTEITFKLKPTTKFANAFEAFAKKTERKITELRFLYEGERLNGDQTIEEVGMEDGDTVDVHMEQIGGYNYSTAVGDKNDAQLSVSAEHVAPVPDPSTIPHDRISTIEQCMNEMRIRITELEAKLDLPTTNDHELQADEEPDNSPSLAHDSPASATALQVGIFKDVASDSPTRNLFLSNIDSEVDDATLNNWLSDFGYSNDGYGVKVERHGGTGVSKGYTTLFFCEEYEAIHFYHELNGAILYGKPIKVQYAKTREEAVTARVRQLKIEEEVQALPSLAELADTEMGRAPPGSKISLILKLESADATPTIYVIRRDQPLKKLVEHFQERFGRTGSSAGMIFGGMKGCYSATNYMLDDGDVIIARHASNFRQSWTYPGPARAWCTVEE